MASAIPHLPNGQSTTDNGQNAQTNRFEIIGAMDIGTSSSGYAYQSKTDPKIYCKKWNDNTSKTLTCLLLKPDKTFVAFGSYARTQYYRHKKGKMENYLYFENFKMMIYNRADRDDETAVEAANGEHVPAIDVFSKIIEHMKSDFMKNLVKKGTLRGTQKEEIPEHPSVKWVITVPAIWDEVAKGLMYRAAVKAGISKDRLVLALEPECAAILCAQHCEEYNIYDTDGTIERIIQPGSVSMVVDIGGGTVDISVIKIKDDRTMEQLHKSGGNGFGGVRINDAILKKLINVFGSAVIREFCEKNPGNEKDLRDDIEQSKRMWKAAEAQEDDSLVLKFSDTLLDVWKKHNGTRRLSDTFLEHNVTRDGGHLELDEGTIKEMFDECVESIMQYLDQALKVISLRRHVLNAVLVVGGCAESDYIMTSLREKLEERKIPVIRPEDPEMSVMKGAVLYGRNENIISSRVTTKTYGVGMTTKFDEKRNDENEKYEDENGEVWANNVFRKHVEIGQDVPVHEWIQGKEYYPDGDKQTSQRVYIFQSDKKNPNHTTEEGCSCIGHVDVEFPPGGDNNDRKVTVEFFFGGTMILVRTRTKGQTKTETMSSYGEGK